MVLGGGAHECWLNQEGGTHVTGISALKEEIPASLVTLSAMWKNREKCCLWTGKKPDPELWSYSSQPWSYSSQPWSCSSQPLELRETSVATQPLIFYYNNLKGLWQRCFQSVEWLNGLVIQMHKQSIQDKPSNLFSFRSWKSRYFFILLDLIV